MPKQPPSQANPIQTAIQRWIELLPPLRGDLWDGTAWIERLYTTAPKRFTIYEPLAMLPSGSFAHEAWISILRCQDEESLNRLWSFILEELSRGKKAAVTHLAVNGGIPLHKEGQEAENVRRSPSSLRMLFGDFGPAQVPHGEPTEGDFGSAFWVSTKQNGIHQTWAPRWTMFSRGNVKEKARVLGFGNPGKPSWAVDLYAGIGYFTFSYAALGLRVLCWEINPWSVEALRRGAMVNRWSVKVVQGRDLALPMDEIMAGDEQILVFLESNEEALTRVKALQDMGLAHDIKHVNCGFLPTSEPTWRPAWEITRRSSETWLHLHENVGVADMESRRRSIQVIFDDWTSKEEEEEKEENVRKADVEHVEQVKTFAPDIWHCVFDVHVSRQDRTGSA